jgi:cbb3-type cytochrome oxidase maturation protein
MSILFLLIPLGLVLVAFAVWAFFWAVNSGQFEDLDHASDSVIKPD